MIAQQTTDDEEAQKKKLGTSFPTGTPAVAPPPPPPPDSQVPQLNPTLPAVAPPAEPQKQPAALAEIPPPADNALGYAPAPAKEQAPAIPKLPYIPPPVDNGIASYSGPQATSTAAPAASPAPALSPLPKIPAPAASPSPYVGGSASGVGDWQSVVRSMGKDPSIVTNVIDRMAAGNIGERNFIGPQETGIPVEYRADGWHPIVNGVVSDVALPSQNNGTYAGASTTPLDPSTVTGHPNAYQTAEGGWTTDLQTLPDIPAPDAQTTAAVRAPQASVPDNAGDAPLPDTSIGAPADTIGSAPPPLPEQAGDLGGSAKGRTDPIPPTEPVPPATTTQTAIDIPTLPDIPAPTAGPSTTDIQAMLGQTVETPAGPTYEPVQSNPQDTFSSSADALKERLDIERQDANRYLKEQMARRGLNGSSIDLMGMGDIERKLANEYQTGLADIQARERGYDLQQQAQDIQQRQFATSMAEQVASRIQQGNQFAASLKSDDTKFAIQQGLQERALQLQASGMSADQAYRNASLEVTTRLQERAQALTAQGIAADSAYRYAALEQDSRFRDAALQLQRQGMDADEAYRQAESQWTHTYQEDQATQAAHNATTDQLLRAYELYMQVLAQLSPADQQKIGTLPGM